MHNRLGWRVAPLLLILMAIAPWVRAAERPVTFGVFPYVSPVQLVRFQGPLRAYLEETLGRHVILESAPSIPTFVQRTRQGIYDYVLTAPHLGRLAEYRDAYHPLAKTGHQVKGIYLVPKDSSIRTLADLKGHSIMMVGEGAVLSQLAARQLAALGLHDGVNIKIRRTRTHNNAMYASLRGDADVSLTGALLFQKVQRRDQDKVRIVGETEPVPGFILLAAPRVPAEERERVRRALMHFHEQPGGVGYFRATGFKALLPIDEAQMQRLQPFITRWLAKP